ncbi:ATPase family associated with various cellular activities (AAA) [Raineya orbicola]|jgi:SpoVK/Ycf46/Vps4 family AAA+-type ATPase|uniref:ATPase family associated with various cellular activities (AAA) n=2 Tax=Raineya orbicola TaxID=2016530 RepID=A0A2N3IJK8_9BACT|nr:ATPase family associated with various cellular activities (AAA) [Raineya orbicola]
MKLSSRLDILRYIRESRHEDEGSFDKFLPFNTKILNGDWNEPINTQQLYLSLSGKLPSTLFAHNVNTKKAKAWIERNFQEEIEHRFNSRNFNQKTKKFIDWQSVYLLKNGSIIDISVRSNGVACFFSEENSLQAETIIKETSKFKRKSSRLKPSISVIINTSMGGFDTKSIDVIAPQLNIEDNYNDDFLPIHETILKRLSQKNDKGLVLLHGKPGTGKTSYIRYLISKVKKNIIFLPPHLALSLTSPDLISLVLENTNSIFVIEDAENLIVSRDSEQYSPVSTLLNLTDGLLSDSLSIQIICTFNTDISRIDKALMRKGRLIAKYEFRPLEIEKAQKLVDKLGLNKTITEPTTLAEIYNNEEIITENYTEPRRIGF